VHCDHEYLNFKGAKLSKSRGAFVEVPYFLNKYDPDALRFYLTATAPETRDTPTAVLVGGFRRAQQPCPESCEGNELVATWGSPGGDGQRPRVLGFMLSFACKRFDGVVPEPGELDAEDKTLLEKVEAGFETVGELYNACKFRAALGEALALAREANGYLDRKAPWFQIKEDKAAAATTVYVTQSVRVVDNLKTILAPRCACRTRRRSCTSTWGTRGSCSAPSAWWSTRKKRASIKP
jgi:methionyl-tRNA synthetase